MSRILIIDDDATIVKLVSECVEKDGHTPVEAEGGMAGWNILCSGEKIDLVITDIDMPDFDGRMVIEKIKSDDRLRNIPVIAISGAVAVTEVADIMNAGARDFLKKPFSISVLSRIIRESLEAAPKI